jgi:hypothetical protein
MEKTQKDINRKKEPTDENLEALSGLFGLALILTLIWLMERYF